MTRSTRIASYFFPALTLVAIGCFAPPPSQNIPISSYTAESMKSWLGRSDASLVEACGTPTTTRTLPDGSKLLIYEMHTGGWFIASSQVVPDKDQTTRTVTVAVPSGGSYVTRQFTISPQHVIVDWAANGE